MDQIFSFLWQPHIFRRLYVTGGVCIVVANWMYSAKLLAIGFGLLALAVMTFVWEDSKQYPEVE